MPQYFFNSRRRSTRNKSNDTRKILVMPCGLVFFINTSYILMCDLIIVSHQ